MTENPDYKEVPSTLERDCGLSIDCRRFCCHEIRNRAPRKISRGRIGQPRTALAYRYAQEFGVPMDMVNVEGERGQLLNWNCPGAN